jgi:hypothetical protein
MTPELNSQQAFLILSMIFGEDDTEREPMMSKAPIASAKMRNDLVKKGLITEEKRGRAKHLALTDAAWAWAGEHLSTPLPKTQRAAKVLGSVLKRLEAFLVAHDAALGEFVGGSIASRTSQRATVPDGIEELVRGVYLELSHGRLRERVRLKDLRPRVPAGRELLDSVLERLQREGKLVLMRLDNPQELTRDDDDAALHIAGNPRHLVYLEG